MLDAELKLRSGWRDRRALHRRRRRGARLLEAPRTDRRALPCDSRARGQIAFTAPAIWRASCPTATSTSLAAPIIRSSCADIALSPARSKRCLRNARASARPLSSCAKTAKATSGWSRISWPMHGSAAAVRTAGDLRAALGAKLPDYMVPSAFVFLRRAAAHRQRQDRSQSAAQVTCRRISRIRRSAKRCRTHAARWSALWRAHGNEALGIPSVGINDNFFDLGAHSLTVAECTRQAAGSAGPRDCACSISFSSPRSTHWPHISTRNPPTKPLARGRPANFPSVPRAAEWRISRRPQRHEALSNCDRRHGGPFSRGAQHRRVLAEPARRRRIHSRSARDAELLAAGAAAEDLANPDYVQPRRDSRRRAALRRGVLRIQPARRLHHGSAAPAFPGMRVGGAGRRGASAATILRLHRCLCRIGDEHLPDPQPARQRNAFLHPQDSFSSSKPATTRTCWPRG